MSRTKSPERILLDKERAIRRERREQKRKEKEDRRVAREAKRTARKSYDAKNGGDYTMKRSEAEPRHLIFCSICGDLKNWAQFMPGDPPVCCDCDALVGNQQCWMHNRKCPNRANVLLRDPNGKAIGYYCKKHAEDAIQEYRDKLGEEWNGRATPAEPGTTAVGATPQLALFES